jgi:O-antigen ligase
VRDLRDCVTLERALQGLIVTTIVASVLAAGALLGLLSAARAVRWLSLGALLVVALVLAVRRGDPLRPDAVTVLAAGLIVLALLSAAWSSEPGETVARTLSLAAVIVSAAAISHAVAGRPARIQGIVAAIAAGAVAVAVGGLLVLVFAHDRAVLGASAQAAARYRGLGGGPNVAAMALAVAVPLAVHLAVAARSLRTRLLVAGGALLLIGSIVASGSRGALGAAFAGLLVYAALAPRARRSRVVAVAAAGALFAASALATRIPDPDPTVAALPGTTLPDPPIPARGDYFDANVLWRLQEDVGRAPWGEPAGETGRSFLGGSGRVEAWEGTVRLAAERPVLGYGFGLEGVVFVDRYFAHGSNLPENSYIGVFLQLGVAGLVLLLALLAALVFAGVRTALRTAAPVRGLAAAALGGVAAGLVLALTQSYLYSAGNNATLPVWLCAFLLPAMARTPAADHA